MNEGYYYNYKGIKKYKITVKERINNLQSI